MNSTAPELPPHAALLLDLDGTLLDIAPTPDSVVVPPSLPRDLLALRRHLGDALAIVTGRSIEQVDALLPGIPYAVAGEHGGAIRHAPNEAIARADLPTAPDRWFAAAERLATARDGVLLERKTRGFVLHFRLAPHQADALHDALLSIIAGDKSAADFSVMPAHMAWEVKPRGADKGVAVAQLMVRNPFVGRTPVYIGDDVTDEDGMREARRYGGVGLRVQEVFADAGGVREWLAAIAANVA